jgi:hypothetical protein
MSFRAYSILSSILALPMGKLYTRFRLCISNKCNSISNLIFVFYVEQNRQDRSGRRSNDTSLRFVLPLHFLVTDVTEITELVDTEVLLEGNCSVVVAKLLEILLYEFDILSVKLLINHKSIFGQSNSDQIPLVPQGTRYI